MRVGAASLAVPDVKRKGLVVHSTDTPVVLRLIRLEVRAKASRKKSVVWLVTNVLEESKLTRAEAGALYQKRWRAKHSYRDWKKTLDESKLNIFTPEMTQPEQELDCARSSCYRSPRCSDASRTGKRAGATENS